MEIVKGGLPVKKNKPYDVRVTVDAVTWATSVAEAIRLTEEELSNAGYAPAPESPSTAKEWSDE